MVVLNNGLGQKYVKLIWTVFVYKIDFIIFPPLNFDSRVITLYQSSYSLCMGKTNVPSPLILYILAIYAFENKNTGF
jgi:hypothetical protein